MPSEVVGVQRCVVGGLSGEGERVDFGRRQAADVGHLLGLGGFEADKVTGVEDRARGEAAQAAEIHRPQVEAVGQAQEVAGQSGGVSAYT